MPEKYAPWVADCNGLDTFNQAAVYHCNTGEIRVLLDFETLGIANEPGDSMAWAHANAFAVEFAKILNAREEEG